MRSVNAFVRGSHQIKGLTPLEFAIFWREPRSRDSWIGVPAGRGLAALPSRLDTRPHVSTIESPRRCSG